MPADAPFAIIMLISIGSFTIGLAIVLKKNVPESLQRHREASIVVGGMLIAYALVILWKYLSA